MTVSTITCTEDDVAAADADLQDAWAAHNAVRRRYELANARAIARQLLYVYPAAATLALIENPDVVESIWVVDELLDVDGNVIDTGDNLGEEVDEYDVAAIPTSYPYLDSRGPDTAFSWLTIQGDRHRGYTTRIDLRLAAGLGEPLV